VSIASTQAELRLALPPAQLSRRALVILALVFALGLPAWSVLAAQFAYGFRALCALSLAPLTFGEGGHVQFVMALPARSLERADSWDVSMVLGIEGVTATHSVALNSRRLLYLPLLTLLACVVAAPFPLSKRQRAIAGLVGAALLALIALLAVWVIAAFLFAKVPGLVYTLTPWQHGALRLAYEGWVTPLTNKFVMPILLAGGLLAWQSQRQKPTAIAKDTQRDTASGAPQRSASQAPRGPRTKPHGQKRAGAQRKKGSAPTRRS
jgi:hypothetical protein